MRFTKIINPELVLNKRGCPITRNTLQDLSANVAYNPTFRRWIATRPIVEGIDSNVKEFACMVRKFKDELPESYYIPTDFAQALSSIDREVPIDLLPEKWFGYIEFGSQAIFDEVEEMAGAYVFIGPRDETPFVDVERKIPDGQRVLWISLIARRFTAEHMTFTSLMLPLAPGKLSDNLNKIETWCENGVDTVMDPTTAKKRREGYLVALNAVLYINSVGADLERIISHTHMRGKQRLRLVRDGKITVANECTLPITLVSYHYKKPVRYQVDSTWIDTHMRWQRCGTGHSQVKLIWVQSHERHYNKGEDASAPEGG